MQPKKAETAVHGYYHLSSLLLTGDLMVMTTSYVALVS